MTDTVLSQDLAVALLKRLGSDDAFRRNYMANPAQALLAIGVPSDTLDAMPPGSLPPLNTLADKSVFLAALAQIQANMAEVCVCFHAPTIRFNFGR